jgi:hypothetical protein
MKFLFNIYASLPLTSLARLVSALLIGCLVVSLTHATERKLDPADAGNPIKLDLQMGLDVWQLSTPDRTTSVLKGVDRLYLADSYTTWTYRNPAPWVKTTGEWDINSQLNLTYKARADQSIGAKVDDFNLDYRLSPKLGFRTGVLDYKTSWCRTYEIDSPWIYQIDPFCSTRITNESTLASPGVQAYVNFTPGDYLIQALVGIYRPKVFGYNKEEFSNVANTKGVAVNDRWGWSINALNLNSASELRLSWLGARQENNRDSGGYRSQNAGALYAGGSFFLTEKLNLRATIFHSLVRQNSYDTPPTYTKILETNMVRVSKTLEAIYQHDAQNTLGIAASRYTNNWGLTGMNGYEPYTNPNYYLFTQSASSVTWRHNWSEGIHSSIQWTQSKNDQLLGNTAAKAKGTALGFRIGYTY